MISRLGYDKNAKRKRWVFNFDLKISNDLESLTSNGNAFQSFGAAQVNDLSPSVTLDLKLGCLRVCTWENQAEGDNAQITDLAQTWHNYWVCKDN